MRAITWNSRSLLHGEVAKRSRKLDLLRGLLRSGSLVALQEVHGSREALLVAMHGLGVAPLRVFSSHASTRAGGVALLLPACWLDGSLGFVLSATMEVHVPGRIVRISAVGANRTVVVWNVHNHEVGASRVAQVCAAIQRDLTAAAGDPDNFLVIVLGDFNISDGVRARERIVPGRAASSMQGGAAVGPLQHRGSASGDLIINPGAAGEDHFGTADSQEHRPLSGAPEEGRPVGEGPEGRRGRRRRKTGAAPDTRKAPPTTADSQVQSSQLQYSQNTDSQLQRRGGDLQLTES